MSAQTTMATLRAATMADATALGRMILEGHVDAPSSPFEADELEPEPALLGGEFILAALDGSELLFRLDGPRGELVGCVRVVPREFLRAGHVGSVQLLVRPAWRRRGLGRAALLGLMAHRAVTGRFERLEVQVTRADEPQMALLAALATTQGWGVERVEVGAARLGEAFSDILTWATGVDAGARHREPQALGEPEAPRSGPAAGRGVGGLLGLAAAAAATLGACATGSRTGEAPDARDGGDKVEVLGGPRIYTGDPAAPWADWVEVGRDGRVVGLGLGPRTLTRLLPGDLAVPGLADHHAHLGLLGRAVETAQLQGLADVAAIARAVRRHAEVEREAGVVAGFGWELDAALAPGFRGAEALAGLDARQRPIALTRADGHALWVDAVALALLAARGLLTDGGGQRVLRATDGQPTGLILEPTLATWEALRDEGEGRAARRIARGLARLMSEGVVEVHALATPVGDLPALVAARASLGGGPRHLPEREKGQERDRKGRISDEHRWRQSVGGLIAGAAPDVVVWLEDTPEARAWLAERPGGVGRVGPGVVVRGLKLFADGALGSRGAALRHAYCDAHGTHGRHAPVEELSRSARVAIAAGFDVAIHAIGDRAVEVALDALEQASDVARPGHPYRHRLEHAQLTTAADRARMAQMAVTASMQPLHACSDAPWAPARLGLDRLAGAYAAASMREAGVPLVFGSDAPLDGPGLLDGLRAAVTRRCGTTALTPDWLERQAIPLEAALHAYGATETGAPQGRVAVGAPLALSLFSLPPRAGQPSLDALLTGGARAVATWRPESNQGARQGSRPNL